MSVLCIKYTCVSFYFFSFRVRAYDYSKYSIQVYLKFEEWNKENLFPKNKVICVRYYLDQKA